MQTTDNYEYFFTMQDLPLFSMWYKGESIGRLEIKKLLIRNGHDGGNHTIKEWRNIFSSIGIVFINPVKEKKKVPENSVHTLFDYLIDVSKNGI